MFLEVKGKRVGSVAAKLLYMLYTTENVRNFQQSAEFFFTKRSAKKCAYMFFRQNTRIHTHKYFRQCPEFRRLNQPVGQYVFCYHSIFGYVFTMCALEHIY